MLDRLAYKKNKDNITIYIKYFGDEKRIGETFLIYHLQVWTYIFIFSEI